MEDYLKVNKEAWDERAEKHYDSEFYDTRSFIEGRNSLPSIDIKMLGDIRGKSVLHLQCHFGQDSISLSRMGAYVTGVDFSETAIDKARNLTEQCGTDTKFICSDVYSVKDKLEDSFDITYTSYGTIGWLPDIRRWAEIVSSCTKKGGKFVFVEFHPIIWMFDDTLSYIQYSYFKSEPIVETLSGSYADKDKGSSYKSISWNHGMSEVIQALLDNGFQLDILEEHPYSPYEIFPSMKKMEKDKYVLEKFGDKMPMVYALSMTKN